MGYAFEVFEKAPKADRDTAHPSWAAALRAPASQRRWSASVAAYIAARSARYGLCRARRASPGSGRGRCARRQALALCTAHQNFAAGQTNTARAGVRDAGRVRRAALRQHKTRTGARCDLRWQLLHCWAAWSRASSTANSFSARIRVRGGPEQPVRVAGLRPAPRKAALVSCGACTALFRYSGHHRRDVWA